MTKNIRAFTAEDLSAAKTVIDSSELFPSHLLNNMVSGYLSAPGSSEEIWLVHEENHQVNAVAYCEPEQMTSGTYNLYLIAVSKEHQGKGTGRKLMDYIEAKLSSQGVRILLVETSGLPDFALTREFYDKCGYTREARIRDFYAAGEDKIVFRKKLSNQDFT